MNTVTSNDGTSIAFDRLGEGPPLILVGGATATRADTMPLAAILAPYFTVLNPDRRGRGESGDTLPYAVAREVEDIDALISAAGGSAFVFGHSSGAVLALEATRLLLGKVTRLAVYEPPFIVDDSRPSVPQDYVAQLDAAIAAGRPGDALEIFMTRAVGIPAAFVAQMRNDPNWTASERVAHTIAYDGTIMGDTMRGSPLPLKKWAAVTVPTLVLDGEKSDAWMHAGAQALAQILPAAQRRTLAGQDHGAAPEVLTPVLVEFFLEREQRDPQAGELPVELASPARRALVNAGYVRLEQLAELNAADLKQLHGIGPKALDQLRRALTAQGLSFADERSESVFRS